MPHIVAKLRTGYSKRQKARLAEALSKAIVETLDCPNFDVSVAIEDVRPTDWAECVYRPDILAKSDTIYKPPGDDSLGKPKHEDSGGTLLRGTPRHEER